MSRNERRVKYFSQPSRTQQSFKDECDVNKIMKKFKKIMGADYLSRYNGIVGGQFGDFSGVTDYRTAIEQVRAAKGVFEQLPAVIRKRFDHDPASFLDFCHDPKNIEELKSLGLTKTLDSPVLTPVSSPKE